MIRFVMGVSIACLIVGCGDDADTKTDDKKDASTTPATATENVASADPADNATTTTEEPAQEEQEAALTTVKFKVPGMT